MHRRRKNLDHLAGRLADCRAVLLRRSRSSFARRIARRRVASYVLALAVACTVWVTVTGAQQSRAMWGEVVEVAVARHDLRAGAQIGPDDVELQLRPVGLVPGQALTQLPHGRRASSDLVQGEVIVTSRLARSGVGATAAVLPRGTAAVTVPLGSAAPPLEPGDRVDVLAPSRAAAEPWEPGTGGVEVVAAAAQVISLSDGHATLVVERTEVEGTAAAVLDGTVAVVLTG